MNSVAIVAMGASSSQYIEAARAAGSRHAVADETWGINVMGGVVECDRIFHMDDVELQERRAPNNPAIAGLLKTLKSHPGPIYTSRPTDAYPGLVAFPLEQALNELGCGTRPYFTTTTAYAMAFAILSGVPLVKLYGMDFAYAGGTEDGRACLEYWIGFAVARGVTIRVASRSSLLDTNKGFDDRLYGYDGLAVEINPDETGRVSVVTKPRELPSAEAIERRYNAKHRPPAVR